MRVAVYECLRREKGYRGIHASELTASKLAKVGLSKHHLIQCTLSFWRNQDIWRSSLIIICPSKREESGNSNHKTCFLPSPKSSFILKISPLGYDLVALGGRGI